MSAYTSPIVKRVVSATDNPQGVVDHLITAATAQVFAASFAGAGRLIPAIDQFCGEVMEESTTQLENRYLDRLTPWTV